MNRGAPGAAIVLTLVTTLFFARVAGQALVAFAGVGWLPPMDAWYSGLLPYSVLLPVQILILGAQLTIDWQVWRDGGFFARPRPRVGRALRTFSYVYALAMLVRWLATRTHGIPIAFHWVLAAYLFTLGRFYEGRAAAPLNAPRAEATPTETTRRPVAGPAAPPRPPRSARTR